MPTASSFFLLFFLALLSFSHTYSCCTKGVKKDENQTINGMFVFGSSLVDNGNNNFLENASAKADYLPYGIDFPLGPTGRFSNGKNMIDALGELLKLPSLIPAFLDPMTKGSRILHGVNHASGASGILDDTGSLSGQVICLNEQIENFEKVTLPQLRAQLGCRSTKLQPVSLLRILSNYLFVVATGGNDYFLNYFLSTSNNKVDIQTFTSNLTSTLSHQLKKLYRLGARKFVLVSIYPIGCIPAVKAEMNVQLGCIETLNQAALLFNADLKSLVDVMKPQMPGSNLVYVNSYGIIRDIIEKPISKGFNDTSNACCEVPFGRGGILCKREGHSCGCGKRKTHVFFDGLHPTEAVNVLVAKQAYASSLTFEAYPINIQQLAQL